ncbi:FAD-dependent oxidoreductase [Streptomyces sp. NPDC046197]|uniref:FAD-dependent oxidoreductase n=1 Tax=Streptomyces sp. NPDC046197 TaxID=3154337 RepID=UPI00340C7A4A
MRAKPTFVIVGASLAGAKAAEALRERGFDGPIVLFGDEPDPPYERPPLSRGYLMGKREREAFFVHPAQWDTDHEIDLLLDNTVTTIDREARGHRLTVAAAALSVLVSSTWRRSTSGARTGHVPAPRACAHAGPG